MRNLDDLVTKKTPEERQKLKDAKSKWKAEMRDKNLDPKKVLKADKNISSKQ